MHKLSEEVSRLAADIGGGDKESYEKFRALTKYIQRISEEIMELDKKSGGKKTDK